jgi:superfamily II DNA helicase RecQ
MNQFLENKIVRHWGTEFGGDPINGVWNVFIAFEERTQDERRTPRAQEQGKNDRNDRDRNDRGDRNDRDRNDRGDRGDRNDRSMDRGPREAKNDRGPKREGSRERPPRPELIIDVSQEDMPLYEAIRKWRNSIAKEKDLKPFSLFNNSQMQSIVKAKPQTADALKALLPEITPDLWEKYHNELLGFISGAVADRGSSASTASSEALKEAPSEASIG